MLYFFLTYLILSVSVHGRFTVYLGVNHCYVYELVGAIQLFRPMLLLDDSCNISSSSRLLLHFMYCGTARCIQEQLLPSIWRTEAL